MTPAEPLVAVEADRLLKYREVAYMLGIPAAKVYELTAAGDLPSVMLPEMSRARRWRLSDVQAYLRSLPYAEPANPRRPPARA